MNTTLILIVFISAIIMAFLQEFIRIGKKIIAIRGIKLWGPLIISSIFVEVYLGELNELFLEMQAGLHRVMFSLTFRMPLEPVISGALAMSLLVIFACLPIWLAHGLVKIKGMPKLVPYVYYVSAALWMMGAFLLVI